MQGPKPNSFAFDNDIDFPRETLISPGEDMDRKQQENNNNSHQEFIKSEI